MAASKHDYLLVAAIDFGTTYSGYAIQFQHEYDPRTPLKSGLRKFGMEGKRYAFNNNN